MIFHQAAQFKSQMKSYSLEELRSVFDVLLIDGHGRSNRAVFPGSWCWSG